eukprot:scaffold37562_cov22-Cyclotella_meneghiniana.AAC.1
MGIARYSRIMYRREREVKQPTILRWLKEGRLGIGTYTACFFTFCNIRTYRNSDEKKKNGKEQ